MSKKLSPEAQRAYDVIQRCVAAVSVKPLSTNLEDFPGSVMMPARPETSLRKRRSR